MNEYNPYPKFQYSVFPGGNRDEQLVVRAGSFEDLQLLKQAIAPLVGAKPASNGEDQVPAKKAMTCAKCGGKAEYREGVSKKTDKPFKGVFCLDRDCDFAKFL